MTHERGTEKDDQSVNTDNADTHTSRYPNSDGRDSAGRFAIGNKGSPGKPKGTRHKVTLAVEALLDGQAEGLTQKAIEKALSGDVMAMRLCLERISPPRKDRTVILDMPKLDKAADAPSALAAIVEAAAKGEITPSEGSDMARLIEVYTKSAELLLLEARIAALEQGLK